MEIIKPDEMPKEEAKAEPEPEAPQAKPFTCEFRDEWMTLKVNLAVAAANEDMFLLMRGFLDSKRDQCLGTVLAIRQKIADQKNVLLKKTHDSKLRNFLNGLTKH